MLKYVAIITAYLILVGGCQPCQAGPPLSDPDSLFLIVANQQDNTEKADNLILLTQYYLYENLDTAMVFGKKALVLATALDYREGMADAFYKISRIHKSKGERNASIAMAFRFIEVSDSLQDSMRLAKAYYHLANLTRNASNKQPALDYYKKSLRIYMDAKDTIGIYANYNSLGNYFLETSSYDSAAIYYHKTIELCELIGRERSLGTIFSNLGKVYMMLKEFENARKYLNMSLEYDKKYPNVVNMARTYNKLGSLANKENDFRKALRYYDRADSLFREKDDARGINNVHLNYGDVYRQQGKYRLAINHYNKALDYYREQNFAEGMIAAWHGKAEIYSKQKKYGQALIFYDSCLRLAIESGDLNRRRDILGSISKTYYSIGNLRKAYEFQSRFYNLKDSIFDLEKSEKIADLLLKYEKEKDQLRIATQQKEILAKDLRIRKRTNQRNIYFFTGLGIIALTLFLLIFFRYKARKDKIIAGQKIRQLEEEKKLLAARFLVEGQEEERKRIAKELHDGLGVLLSVAKMQFSAIKDTSPKNKPLIEKATRFLEQASGDVRKISHNMMPGLLTKLGLYEALEDLFEKLSDTEDIQALCEINGAKERLPENKEIMLYRIIQEMANNTLKHAEATKVELHMDVQSDRLDVRFSDNGKGFEMEEDGEQKSMGLQSIWSRVKFLDGTISIDSSPGKGTVYTIQIPV